MSRQTAALQCAPRYAAELTLGFASTGPHHRIVITSTLSSGQCERRRRRPRQVPTPQSRANLHGKGDPGYPSGLYVDSVSMGRSSLPTYVSGWAVCPASDSHGQHLTALRHHERLTTCRTLVVVQPRRARRELRLHGLPQSRLEARYNAWQKGVQYSAICGAMEGICRLYRS
ncbi:hypothetical protein BV25DRAFT_1592816 [Artomyces pyxidatus]|uniref:Uncharacterized protein n=1 Tax=Artomyces pyxidatus TaxID=48021 RepID=A0ACB8TBS3_9AGAM|nr:hypothetical protein BV25DRAFT_1592816 [Artomyces pyxidatus]